MTNHDIYGRRLCTVDHARIGYFHMWEQYSEPIEASPLLGGAPAGVISKVYATCPCWRNDNQSVGCAINIPIMYCPHYASMVEQRKLTEKIKEM